MLEVVVFAPPFDADAAASLALTLVCCSAGIADATASTQPNTAHSTADATCQEKNKKWGKGKKPALKKKKAEADSGFLPPVLYYRALVDPHT